MNDLKLCALCGVLFRTSISEEDAWAEANRKFPDVPREDFVVICNPCYVKLNSQFN